MYARVVTWEGGQEDAMRASAADIEARSADGPPPGLPAKGVTMLLDPESGKSIAIVLFETEEDMREGDAKLNSMSPSDAAIGTRTSVDFYEVGVDFRA